MAQELQIPPPIRGMATEEAYLQQPGYARFLRNYLVQGSGIRQRPEQSVVTELTPPNAGDEIVWLDYKNEQVLWSDGDVYDLDTVLVSNTSSSDLSDDRPFEVRFRDELYLCWPRDALAPFKRSGTTWAAFPFTLATLTSTLIDGGCAYRGRVYFWGNQQSAPNTQPILEYGGLDSITGNTTAYDITSFCGGGTIRFARPVTIEQGLATSEVLVVYLNTGRVLVFQGDDPGANNWALTGRFEMTEPMGYFSFVDVEGDVIVLGRDYVYSTREMFTGGAQAAEQNSLIKPIRSLYKQLTRRARITASSGEASAASSECAFGYFLEEENTILLCLGNAADAMYSDDTTYGLAAPASWEVGATVTNYFRRIQVAYCRDTGAVSLLDIPNFSNPVNDYTDSSGERYTYYGFGECILQLDFELTLNGKDELCENDRYSTLSLSGGHTLSDGGNGQYSNIECVWSTPVFKQLKNVRVTGVQPSVKQENGLVISSCGVIGNESDLELKRLFGLFIRDEDATYNSLDTYNVSTADILDAPVLEDVGMQKQYMHATIRINEMGTSSAALDRTGTKFTTLQGMSIFYEPGGPGGHR